MTTIEKNTIINAINDIKKTAQYSNTIGIEQCELELKQVQSQYFFKEEEISYELPFLPVKENWLIKPIANFAGSVSRLLITNKEQTRTVSVYADVYDKLGYVGKPYYEVYLFNEGHEPERFLINEVDKMIKSIDKILKS